MVEQKTLQIMNISSETDSLEPGNGFPIEVKVIVFNANGVQNVYPDNDNQEEGNDSVANKSSYKNLHLLDTTTSDSENRKLDNNVVIDIENETPAEENEFAIRLTDKADNLDYSTVDISSAPIPPPEQDDILTEESHTKIDVPSSQEKDVFNRFLNELYEKELDLHNKFSDEEIGDIRAAVIEQVNLIGKRIYEIDSRFKIHEVLLVGSAREGTQIIRPCEYDFILTLEALSKRGAVSITPEDPQGDSREYMHVKLEDNDVRSVFHEFSDNGNVIASRLLPWNRQGLRDLFSAAVRQAVTFCSRSCVVMDTGKLKLKRRKPKTHGPACTISLLWERTTTEKHTTMEISVDLCSALKLDFDDYYSLLPLSDTASSTSLHRTVVNFDSHDLNHSKSNDSKLSFNDNSVSYHSDHSHFNGTLLPSSDSLVSNALDRFPSTESVLLSSGNAVPNDLDHAKRIESVLLMPRDGMRFKVAFTESELLLTSDMSEHHRKCYRLLKYIVNGEPFPLEGSMIRRFFKDTHTCVHSYILKRAVWEHHYFQRCGQEINLGICITEMLSKLLIAKTKVLTHPFNRNRIIETSSEWLDKLPESLEYRSKEIILNKLSTAIKKIKNTPIDAYDFKANFNAVSTVHLRVTIVTIASLAFVFIIILVPMPIFLLTTNFSPMVFVLFIPIPCTGFYLHFARRVIYLKWRLLAIPLSLCTKHIDAWVTCTCLAVLLVFSLLVSKLYFALGVVYCLVLSGLLYSLLFKGYRHIAKHN